MTGEELQRYSFDSQGAVEWGLGEYVRLDEALAIIAALQAKVDELEKRIEELTEWDLDSNARQ